MLDLPAPHLIGVAFAVKKDEPDDPSNIGLFGSRAIVPGSDSLPDLVEQARLGRRCSFELRLGSHFSVHI